MNEQEFSIMNRYILSACAAAASSPVPLGEPKGLRRDHPSRDDWASAGVVVAVSQLPAEPRVWLDVTIVPSDTTPGVTSLSERTTSPDIVNRKALPNSAVTPIRNQADC